MRTYRLSLIKYYLLPFFLLFVGGGIYLLTRDKSLLMFNWVENIGFYDELDVLRSHFPSYKIPEWIKYSLPSGLWSFSYIIMMHLIWLDEDRTKRLIWVLCLPVLAVFSEIFQIPGIIPGTFDMVDLLCYIIPIILYLYYENFKN